MNWEYSCGAVVFTREDGGKLKYVIVQEKEGNYSFPKGHMEGNETEEETAFREVYEEIGLEPVFLEGFREEDEYPLAEKPGTRKRVVYFLADATGRKLVPRPGEIRRILLLSRGEARGLLKHEGACAVLAAAESFLADSLNAGE